MAVDCTFHIGYSTFSRFPTIVVAIHNRHRSLSSTLTTTLTIHSFPSPASRIDIFRTEYCPFKPSMMGSGRSALPAHLSSNANPGTSRQSTRVLPRQRPNPRARMSRSLQPTVFSHDSDPSVQDSLWFANDFMLGAGMVIIQPSTGKMVILSDQYQDARGVTRPYCFLPKGRKDIGESLEQTALREAYEEVCSSFCRVLIYTLATHNLLRLLPRFPPKAIFVLCCPR